MSGLELEAIRGLMEEFKAAQERARKAQDEADGARWELLDSIAEAMGQKDRQLELSSWDCDDSPIGQCVIDCSADACLWCGNPGERK